MTKFFTPGTTPPGFYASKPEIDSVEITDERWQELISAQFSGQQIVVGEGGMPVAVYFPPVPDVSTLPAE
ncbi:TPA: hypothetical protein ACJOGX_003905 [Enterobacter kobei]